MAKVIDLFPASELPHGGTFSNRTEDAEPITAERVIQMWRTVEVGMRRARMHVVKDPGK